MVQLHARDLSDADVNELIQIIKQSKKESLP
jgi:hypothetical protein